LKIRNILTVRSAGILVAIVAILWFMTMYVMNLWLLIDMRGGRQVIHTSVWLPYAASIASIAALVVFARVKSAALGGVLLCAAILWVLSLRVVEVNGVSGEISQYWSDVRLSQDALVARDDLHYCYVLDSFSFNVQADEGAHLRYFRGIWPAAFSKDDIQAALKLSECPS
jgi:hypothetical protein